MTTHLRKSDIMKRDWLGPEANPVAMVVTYRSRKIGSGLPFHYRTLILSGARDCLILDWPDEEKAKRGHEQTFARVLRGEPVHLMLQ
jgi:hypothetical protein